MSYILTIAASDVRLFLKDKSGYLWLFFMPMVFTYLFGVTMRFEDRDPANPRPAVLIENQDQGFLGEVLIREMDAQGMRLVAKDSQQQANRGVLIPEDFTERIRNKEKSTIQFFHVDGTGAEAAAMIEVRLVRAIIALTSGLVTLATDQQDQDLNRARVDDVMSREDVVTLDARFAGREPIPTGFQQSVPAYMVMFLLMNLLMFGGTSISEERTSGVLRRIAIHPITRTQLVFGKILGRFFLGVIQIGFFLAAGALLFQIDYGENLGLITLTLAVFGWGCASLGVLVGALIASSERVQGVCLLASLLMAALGGCWWPMEIVPDTVQAVGHLFPTAWAMDALHQLISFGGGFEQVRHEIMILTGFAVVSTGLAARFLRYA